MNPNKFEIKLVGVVVAFDADTGDVLHVRETFMQTIDGKGAYPTEISSDECEEVRADAAKNFPRRRVDVITAPPEAGQQEGEAPKRYHVDPMTRRLRAVPDQQWPWPLLYPEVRSE